MVTDDASPFIECKDVILCRSGIQKYRNEEIMGLGLSEPKVKKDIYLVMRPASVIVASKELFCRLTITKEHPPDWVTPSNWKKYAEGYTDSTVDVVILDGDEIGLKSSLVFSTNTIYDYYLNNNKETSVGYKATNEWVDFEKKGYDAEMTSIFMVNHLAITAAGRGGSRVAIIDSLLGGMTMAKSGILHFLKRKGKTNDSAIPFSKIVFDSLEASKKLEGDELSAEVARVTDSVSSLKDSPTKTQIVDSVSDLFLDRDTAITNKAEAVKILDALYEKAEKETLASVNDSDEEAKKKDEEAKEAEKKKAEDAAMEAEKDKVKDEDGKGKGTTNISDAEEIKKVTDSAIDSKFAELAATLPDLIQTGVKAALGIKDESKPKGGKVTDSVAEDQNFDMTKFIS